MAKWVRHGSLSNGAVLALCPWLLFCGLALGADRELAQAPPKKDGPRPGPPDKKGGRPGAGEPSQERPVFDANARKAVDPVPPTFSPHDWPAFRGPTGTGAAASDPPTKWSKLTGVKWQTPLPGPGSSSPIVVGDRVFVTCYSGYGVNVNSPGSMDKLTRHLVCLDRATGKVAWQADVPATQADDPYRSDLAEHGYASSTPIAVGDAVYVFFGKSGVLAYDFAGKKKWQTNVGTGSDPRGWGSAASPIVVGDLVIVNAASESRAVVALDQQTGKQVWRAEGNRLALSFSTPAAVADGQRTDVVVAMPNEVWGLNPQTGKLRWQAEIYPNGNICPAVIPSNGLAFVFGGYQARGSVAIKLGGAGKLPHSSMAWESKSSPYVPTPVLHEDRLYTGTEDGIALCMNAKTGDVIYKERLKVSSSGSARSRPYYASTILAGGRLYITSRRAGVVVLKAGDRFEQLHQNPPLDDTDCNATPAAVANQLFLRSNLALYCIEGG